MDSRTLARGVLRADLSGCLGRREFGADEREQPVCDG